MVADAFGKKGRFKMAITIEELVRELESENWKVSNESQCARR